MPMTQVNEINIYYEIIGRGEPLLFIHGLGSSTRDWQDQVHFFAKSYQVILVDVRGHGQSDKPAGPYSISMFANDLSGLLGQLELPPVHVVGISMGGMIGFQLAVDHPKRLKSLVVVNSKPEFLLHTLGDKLKAWQRFTLLRLLGMRTVGKVIGKRLFIKPEQENLKADFIERWAENDPKAYMNSMKAIVGWSVLDQIGNIDCPVLMLASDEDYTPVSEKQTIVDKLSHAELVVIDDARHALPVEKPEAFNRALDNFLSGTAFPSSSF